jgi:hypothetical protein
MSTLPTIYYLAQNEIAEIMQAGAKALKMPGLELQPVKHDMLQLPDDQADAVVTACNLLFAACIEYENGLWHQDTAKDPISLVQARMQSGRAQGVIEALFHGPCGYLLFLALDRAPIAYYELSEASPNMHIIDRTYKAAKMHVLAT